MSYHGLDGGCADPGILVFEVIADDALHIPRGCACSHTLALLGQGLVHEAQTPQELQALVSHPKICVRQVLQKG